MTKIVSILQNGIVLFHDQMIEKCILLILSPKCLNPKDRLGKPMQNHTETGLQLPFCILSSFFHLCWKLSDYLYIIHSIYRYWESIIRKLQRLVINKTHPDLLMEDPTPDFSFSRIVGSVSHEFP